jgi:hypothetical protein
MNRYRLTYVVSAHVTSRLEERFTFAIECEAATLQDAQGALYAMAPGNCVIHDMHAEAIHGPANKGTAF